MFIWIYSHLLRGPAVTKYTEQLSLWIFGWREMSSLGYDWRVSTILLLKKTWGLSFPKSFYIKTSGKRRFSVFPLLNLPSHWVSIVSASSWEKITQKVKYTQCFSKKGQDCGGSLLSVGLKATFTDQSCFTISSTKVKTGELADMRSWDLYIIHGKHWDRVHFASLYVSFKVSLKKQRVALSPQGPFLNFW